MSVVGFAFGFFIGYMLAVYLMSYRYAWRQCCLEHYSKHLEEDE